MSIVKDFNMYKIACDICGDCTPFKDTINECQHEASSLGYQFKSCKEPAIGTYVEHYCCECKEA